MVSFGPGSHTYTPPTSATVVVDGAEGGGFGSQGGYVKFEVDAGVELAIQVGGAGAVPSGGFSPAGSGGDGADARYSSQDDAGGGGGATVVTRSSDGVELAAAGGGGGEATFFSPPLGGDDGAAGGGGGGRGGVGGSVPDASAFNQEAGEDGEGTGVGGDGGDADGAEPTPGGTQTGGGVTVLETTDGGGSAGDGEVIVQFPDVSPPNNVSQTVVNDDEIDVSWESVSGAEYDVEVSVDGGAFEAVTTTSDESITYSAGEVNTHQFRVRATNPDNTSDWALTETVATDPSNLVATGGTFDPIELSWDGARDATEYRVLRAPTSGAAVSDYTEIATTTTESYTDDAEPSTEHHYRIQAVYVGGSDSALSNEATARRKGLLADVQDETTVELGWQAHADSTGGWLVEQRRQYGSEFSAWREVTTTSPSVKQFEAGTSPDTTTQYRVTALTSTPSTGAYGDGAYGDGLYPVAADAESPGTATATTAALGLAPRGVQASGWHVEIVRPDGDGVVEPTILDDVTLNPRLSDKPEVVVPVPRAEKWLDERWERQPVRVWRDGERLPVEQFDNAEIARGDGTDRVRLYLRGGQGLDARYQDDVRDRSAHDVMRDVLDASGYAFTVDPAPQAEDEPFATLTSSQDFAELAEVDQFTAPVAIDDGLRPQRTAYLTPLSDVESAGVDIVNDTTAGWTTSNAVEFPVDEFRSSTWTFETDYPIPAEHVGVWFRIAYDFKGFMLVYLDGQKIESVARSQRSNSKEPAWENMVQLGGFRTADEIDDLEAGEHTLEIKVGDSDPTIDTTFGPEGSVYLDVPAVFDTREWNPDTFATTLDDSGRLDGPPGVYSTQEIDLRIQPIQRTTGAALDAVVSDTTNDQALGVGPIEDDVALVSNTTTVDRDFGTSTRDFIARVRLGGASGDPADSGENDGVEQWFTTYRTVPQELTELEVRYDAIGSPSVTESIDNPIQTVLSQKADRANCIWELQWDADAGEPRVVVTQIGQRTSDADPTLAQYQVTKDLAREVSGATVYGRTQPVEGERFEAESIGVELLNDNIQGGSERVYDDSGTVYQSREDAGEETSGDYGMDYQEGRIAVLQTGEMSQLENYNIDYDWHPVGSVSRSGVDFENELVESLSALRSDAAAGEAASFIVDELDKPQFEAEVTIPQREAGFNLVDAIAPSQLPTPAGERYEIRSIDESAGEIALTLGARRSAGEIIEQIERSLGETAREV